MTNLAKPILSFTILMLAFYVEGLANTPLVLSNSCEERETLQSEIGISATTFYATSLNDLLHQIQRVENQRNCTTGSLSRLIKLNVFELQPCHKILTGRKQRKAYSFNDLPLIGQDTVNKNNIQEEISSPIVWVKTDHPVGVRLRLIPTRGSIELPFY